VIVRNVGKSPRGIRDIHGRYVVIEPGESRDIELDEGGEKWVYRSENLASVVSLKQQAEELGIRIDGRWSDERLRREIDAIHNTNRERAQDPAPGIH